MKQVRTHYDNLKVVRNAPPEVIRAQPQQPEPPPNQRSGTSQSPSRRDAGRATDFGLIVSHVVRNWIGYGAVAILVGFLALYEAPPPPPGPKPYRADPPVVVPQYVRPATAPNGNAWPETAGYVKGYKRLRNDGRSTVTIDNSQNDNDVFVKLVSLNDAEAYPVRQFYIPAHERFTLKQVTAGNYDVRYRDLTDGALSRSEAFDIEETRTANGTRFAAITMTLYKVPDGNSQSFPLAETDF